MQTTEQILVRRGRLLAPMKLEDNKMAAYYAAKALNHFGVVVDQPALMTEEHIRVLSDHFNLTVPESFYSNPQDLKLFTSEELLIEQVVSYIQVELIDGVNSENPDTFKRPEIFKKAFPNYREGTEVVFRNFKMVTTEEVLGTIFPKLFEDLSSYTRGWSETERDEFLLLYNMFEEVPVLKSKDNAIEMLKLTKDARFSKSLDQKDVVKMSVDLIGETKDIKYTAEQKELLLLAISNARTTTLTNKQAKFFNHLSKNLGLGNPKTNNSRSPYKQVKTLISTGYVVEAAEVFAKHGSLLLRNLVWLLSRAKISEIQEIIDLVEIKNPIVGIQLLQELKNKSQGPRTFRFYANRTLVSHVETEHEAKYRKSHLTEGIIEEVTKGIYRKIDEYYMNLPKLGKVFIGDIFNSMPLPFNTSASGSGIDVLPKGSRIPFSESLIRAFIHWEGISDVDFSATVLNTRGKLKPITMYYGNYSSKELGNDLLFSGDDRSSNGAEYFDLNVDSLRAKGYDAVLFSANGFNGSFDKGKTIAGLQLKKDLNTKVWQPQNIFTQMNVSGKSHSAQLFGIDLATKELIVINEITSGMNRTISEENMQGILNLLDADFVKNFNVARIAGLRASEIVSTPEEADVVFDKDYVFVRPTEVIEGEEVVEPEIVRPSDIEKIVALMK